MLDILDSIKQHINKNAYITEIAVVEGIIKQLLWKLNWNTFDSVNEVIPEFSVSNKRVDVALCKDKKPFVFIEVKRIGGINEKAEQQLLGYSFQEGVPIAILTDGNEWNFYLPSLQGKFNERRFYKLDLTQRAVKDISDILERFLSKQFVFDGTAIKNAKEEYSKSQKTKEIKQTLPKAWQELVNDEDEKLVDLLADKVSDLCGHSPNRKQIIDFLGTMTLKPTTTLTVKTEPSQFKNTQTNSQIGFKYNGSFYSAKSNIDIVLQALQTVFASHLETIRDSNNEKINTKNRNFIANDINDLYQNESLKGKCYKEIRAGWYIGTDYTKAQLKSKMDAIMTLTGVNLDINWLSWIC